jgi:DNA-binding XRE family transcriptional regulator
MKTRLPRRNKRYQNGAVQHVDVGGRRMVLLEECDYERLLRKADEWEPPLPAPLPDGNYPAREYMRVSIARQVLRDRRQLGLSQAELARRAGIRREALQRVEQGEVSVSLPTIEKIDRALARLERRKEKAR